MRESLRTRLERAAFNLFPAYRGTGARVTFIASDYSEVRIELPLGWRTRNYVGTIFGGSMYGAIDPVYMLMLMKRLGRGYIVWDKAASIRFRRPGKSTLFAVFRLEHADVAALRQAADEHGKTERHFQVDLVDHGGVVHASFEKLLYVRKGPVPAVRGNVGPGRVSRD
jgi:acyl-coenzyme A thioesterase PaaI-like protein